MGRPGAMVNIAGTTPVSRFGRWFHIMVVKYFLPFLIYLLLNTKSP